MHCVRGTYRKVNSVNPRTSGMPGRSPSGMASCPWAVAALLSCVPSPPPASVCADNHPDHLWGHLAVCIPSWLVIFPDWIHDFSDHSFHKFLRSGKSHSSMTVGI